MKTGVVIGSYGMPEMIRLQRAVIRHNLGPVPILVSDDPSDRSAEIASICDEPGIMYWPNGTRLGHTGGDLAAFWKGTAWAAMLGLEAWAKVSQRMIVDIPAWLGEASVNLLQGTSAISCQQSWGKFNTGYRTELMVFAQDRWAKGVKTTGISRLYPQRRPKPELAEAALEGIINDFFGGQYERLEIIGEDGCEHRKGITWHHADSQLWYDGVFERYGVCSPHEDVPGMWRDRAGYLR